MDHLYIPTPTGQPGSGWVKCLDFSEGQGSPPLAICLPRLQTNAALHAWKELTWAVAPSTAAGFCPPLGAMVARAMEIARADGGDLGTITTAASQPVPQTVLGANLTIAPRPSPHTRINPSALPGLGWPRVTWPATLSLLLASLHAQLGG